MSQEELNTKLIQAARDGQVNDVQEALNDGADVNYYEPFGDQYTPLHHASRNGHIEIVSMLLNWNANPNIPDNEKNTPLHLACSWGRIKCIDLLLACGADHNSLNEAGQKPADRIRPADKNHVAILRLFEKKANPGKSTSKINPKPSNYNDILQNYVAFLGVTFVLFFCCLIFFVVIYKFYQLSYAFYEVIL